MVALDFYEYPSCGTCRKAKKWLEEHNKDIKSPLRKKRFRAEEIF